MTRRGVTLDAAAYLLAAGFTPAQACRLLWARWAYLRGRIGEWPAPERRIRGVLEQPAGDAEEDSPC